MRFGALGRTPCHIMSSGLLRGPDRPVDLFADCIIFVFSFFYKASKWERFQVGYCN